MHTNHLILNRIAKLKATTIFLLILVFIASTPAISQKHQQDSSRESKHGIPNLTAEQKKKMAELRTQLKKEFLPIRNQLGEKKAKLRTLETADKADMVAINTLIDEIHSLQAKMMKLQSAHRQEIRKMLTPDQRVDFDLNGNKNGKHRKEKGNHKDGPAMED